VKGILMKPQMIVATIEGRKTNTRRAEAGLKEINQEPDAWNYLKGSSPPGKFHFYNKTENSRITIKPRYQVGETVYIKEAGVWDSKTKFRVYAANFNEVAYEKVKWQSPLFMPEWAARYFILIKDVRAERLQEITEADYQAEGVRERCSPYLMNVEFKELWDSINAIPKPVYSRDATGKKYISHYESYPWEEGDRVEIYRGKSHYIHGNPWIFRYEFELKGRE
jgi:hypothetical protein